MATPEAGKKPRAKKRNFAKELSDLRAYLKVNIEVLTELGQQLERQEAYEKILQRIPE